MVSRNPDHYWGNIEWLIGESLESTLETYPLDWRLLLRTFNKYKVQYKRSPNIVSQSVVNKVLSSPDFPFTKGEAYLTAFLYIYRDRDQYHRDIELTGEERKKFIYEKALKMFVAEMDFSETEVDELQPLFLSVINDKWANFDNQRKNLILDQILLRFLSESNIQIWEEDIPSRTKAQPVRVGVSYMGKFLTRGFKSQDPLDFLALLFGYDYTMFMLNEVKEQSESQNENNPAQPQPTKINLNRSFSLLIPALLFPLLGASWPVQGEWARWFVVGLGIFFVVVAAFFAFTIGRAWRRLSVNPKFILRTYSNLRSFIWYVRLNLMMELMVKKIYAKGYWNLIIKPHWKLRMARYRFYWNMFKMKTYIRVKKAIIRLRFILKKTFVVIHINKILTSVNRKIFISKEKIEKISLRSRKIPNQRTLERLIRTAMHSKKELGEAAQSKLMGISNHQAGPNAIRDMANQLDDQARTSLYIYIVEKLIYDASPHEAESFDRLELGDHHIPLNAFHMTTVPPKANEGGYVMEEQKTADSYKRSSFHFSVNSAVGAGEMVKEWSRRNTMVSVPLIDLVEANEGRVIGGLEGDFMILGPVQLSKSTKIISTSDGSPVRSKALKKLKSQQENFSFYNLRVGHRWAGAPDGAAEAFRDLLLSNGLLFGSHSEHWTLKYELVAEHFAALFHILENRRGFIQEWIEEGGNPIDIEDPTQNPIFWFENPYTSHLNLRYPLHNIVRPIVRLYAENLNFSKMELWDGWVQLISEEVKENERATFHEVTQYSRNFIQNSDIEENDPLIRSLSEAFPLTVEIFAVPYHPPLEIDQALQKLEQPLYEIPDELILLEAAGDILFYLLINLVQNPDNRIYFLEGDPWDEILSLDPSEKASEFIASINDEHKEPFYRFLGNIYEVRDEFPGDTKKLFRTFQEIIRYVFLDSRGSPRDEDSMNEILSAHQRSSKTDKGTVYDHAFYIYLPITNPLWYPGWQRLAGKTHMKSPIYLWQKGDSGQDESSVGFKGEKLSLFITMLLIPLLGANWPGFDLGTLWEGLALRSFSEGGIASVGVSFFASFETGIAPFLILAFALIAAFKLVIQIIVELRRLSSNLAWVGPIDKTIGLTLRTPVDDPNFPGESGEPNDNSDKKVSVTLDGPGDIKVELMVSKKAKELIDYLSSGEEPDYLEIMQMLRGDDYADPRSVTDSTSWLRQQDKDLEAWDMEKKIFLTDQTGPYFIWIFNYWASNFSEEFDMDHFLFGKIVDDNVRFNESPGIQGTNDLFSSELKSQFDTNDKLDLLKYFLVLTVFADLNSKEHLPKGGSSHYAFHPMVQMVYRDILKTIEKLLIQTDDPRNYLEKDLFDWADQHPDLGNIVSILYVQFDSLTRGTGAEYMNYMLEEAIKAVTLDSDLRKKHDTYEDKSPEKEKVMRQLDELETMLDPFVPPIDLKKRDSWVKPVPELVDRVKNEKVVVFAGDFHAQMKNPSGKFPNSLNVQLDFFEGMGKQGHLNWVLYQPSDFLTPFKLWYLAQVRREAPGVLFKEIADYLNGKEPDILLTKLGIPLDKPRPVHIERILTFLQELQIRRQRVGAEIILIHEGFNEDALSSLIKRDSKILLRMEYGSDHTPYLKVEDSAKFLLKAKKIYQSPALPEYDAPTLLTKKAIAHVATRIRKNHEKEWVQGGDEDSEKSVNDWKSEVVSKELYPQMVPFFDEQDNTDKNDNFYQIFDEFVITEDEDDGKDPRWVEIGSKPDHSDSPLSPLLVPSDSSDLTPGSPSTSVIVVDIADESKSENEDKGSSEKSDPDVDADQGQLNSQVEIKGLNESNVIEVKRALNSSGVGVNKLRAILGQPANLGVHGLYDEAYNQLTAELVTTEDVDAALALIGLLSSVNPNDVVRTSDLNRPDADAPKAPTVSVRFGRPGKTHREIEALIARHSDNNWSLLVIRDSENIDKLNKPLIDGGWNIRVVHQKNLDLSKKRLKTLTDQDWISSEVQVFIDQNIHFNRHAEIIQLLNSAPGLSFQLYMTVGDVLSLIAVPMEMHQFRKLSPERDRLMRISA